LFYIDNETIDGIEFPYIPDSKGQLLIASMTSNFPTRNFDVSKFGLIFGSAQKNIGPAGVCWVIVDENIIKPNPATSVIADYKTTIEKNSLYNTGPTFAIFMMKEYAKFLIDTGGMDI